MALTAMARSSLPLALGLALVAFCLLALPRDARARPQERMVGERQDLSPDDPQVQKAAQAAVASYNMGSNSLYYFRDTHIIKAQSQVRRAGCWQGILAQAGEATGAARACMEGAGKRYRDIFMQYLKNRINAKTPQWAAI